MNPRKKRHKNLNRSSSNTSPGSASLPVIKIFCERGHYYATTPAGKGGAHNRTPLLKGMIAGFSENMTKLGYKVVNHTGVRV